MKSEITVNQNIIGFDKSRRNQEIQYEGSLKQWPKLSTYHNVCIYQRLKHIYQEEVMKPDIFPHMHCTSHLLDKLLQRETFNMVIITLYPHNKGYSLSFCGTDGQTFQESHRTYSQDLLLDYIDKEELPPNFLDYWEQTFPELFYNGCVIVKIKDVRYTLEPQVRHVLLKPHTQSIINDINLIILDQSQVWSTEDKVSVEMSVVNTVQNPLCLDPNLETGIRRFHDHYAKNILNTIPLRSSVVKNSQVSVNRKRKQEESCTANKHLMSFIAKKKHIESLKCESVISPTYKELDDLSLCKDFDKDFKDVDQLARPITKRNEDSEVDYTPKLIEEYILEPGQQIIKLDQKEPSKYRIKLEILQRPANSEYVGTLYVDNKYKEGENNGALCSFTLGSKANASRYIEQFTDIFTKEGLQEGRSVRITHSMPGQPARETFTTTTIEREPKMHGNLRIHNSGKAFMQIGANSTIGSLQQSSLKKHSKIQVQLQQGTAGKTVNAVSTVDGTALGLNTNVMARITKSALSTNQGLNKNMSAKEKIVARKMTITNSKIRPVISGITCSTMKKHISLPNQKVQEPMLNLAEINVGNLHHAISVSSLSPTISNISVANLKGFKSGILRNVANVHTIPATLEGSSTIQTGLQTVHVVSGSKEKQLVANGQNTVSSLSLSLPSLSALLADSSLATSQLSLKKNGSSLDAP